MVERPLAIQAPVAQAQGIGAALRLLIVAQPLPDGPAAIGQRCALQQASRPAGRAIQRQQQVQARHVGLAPARPVVRIASVQKVEAGMAVRTQRAVAFVGQAGLRQVQAETQPAILQPEQFGPAGMGLGGQRRPRRAQRTQAAVLSPKPVGILPQRLACCLQRQRPAVIVPSQWRRFTGQVEAAGLAVYPQLAAVGAQRRERIVQGQQAVRQPGADFQRGPAKRGR
ncbi:hypothetical protein PAERUG_P48_London_17_VIM_2_01_13_06038 [Pseudomonas aeruginosa]|nr:hypothetical protein PAERUG_P48_London_17_VIM_2_01_13_06038 [Pseudomonas aeruginosa]